MKGDLCSKCAMFQRYVPMDTLRPTHRVIPCLLFPLGSLQEARKTCGGDEWAARLSVFSREDPH